MANATTAGQGACNAPFLQLSNFPSRTGYMAGRFCAPVPTLDGIIDCCLPCPITDWVYSDDFDAIPKAASWLNVAGMVCSVLLLISYIVLPVKQTSRHYLTVGLVIAICLMQLGFIIPLGAKPQQCHDAITPNDMYSDFTCAISGAFLLFGGFAGIVWGCLRSISIHLQICWQVVPGKKFFWSSILAGWGIPAIIVAIVLPVTGISYRFGDTCHINHEKALDDYWGPLLAFAAISTILQFTTFGYCIRVYLRSLLNDSTTNSTTQYSSTGGTLPSHNTSRAGSVKTVTPGQAYRRIKKVIALQWRGTAIVLVIVINVVFLAVVFVQMDNTVTAALTDFSRAQPWLLCLVLNEGNKNTCLDKVKEAHLVSSEPIIMAVLLLLSLNGIWSMIFLGRTSMLVGWWEMITGLFRRPTTDFVSVDARRYSSTMKRYEMIMSPPSRPYSLPATPGPVVISSPIRSEDLSPSTRYGDDYFGKETHTSTVRDSSQYRSPALSFSTPRPPSAGGATFSRDFSIRSSQSQQYMRPYTATDDGRSSHTIVWDSTSTYAKPYQ